MNIGLDSWLDVRLALLAFRNVYVDEGHGLLDRAATLLLSALEVCPPSGGLSNGGLWC